MTTITTAELEGAALDYAVAMAGAWQHAHQHFPTMTLDPTFKGYEVFRFEGGRVVCRLVPNNPFRQEYVIYQPSTRWELAGPIIDRERICTFHYESDEAGQPCEPGWAAFIHWECKSYGPTPLIAAMRAYVAHKLGASVDVPQELLA